MPLRSKGPRVLAGAGFISIMVDGLGIAIGCCAAIIACNEKNPIANIKTGCSEKENGIWKYSNSDHS
jgi:hypothetical protein